MSRRACGLVLFVVAGAGLAWTVLLPAPHFSQEVRAETEPASPKAAPNRAPLVGEVDLQRSRAYAFVGKTGLGHDHAAVGQIESGTIRLGAAKDAGSIVFDMASFTADMPAAREYVGLQGEVSASTREKVTENMLGPHVLDVQVHPTATFVLRSALPAKGRRPDGTVQYQLDGDFTLRGVTRPLR